MANTQSYSDAINGYVDKLEANVSAKVSSLNSKTGNVTYTETDPKTGETSTKTVSSSKFKSLFSVGDSKITEGASFDTFSKDEMDSVYKEAATAAVNNLAASTSDEYAKGKASSILSVLNDKETLMATTNPARAVQSVINNLSDQYAHQTASTKKEKYSEINQYSTSAALSAETAEAYHNMVNQNAFANSVAGSVTNADASGVNSAQQDKNTSQTVGQYSHLGEGSTGNIEELEVIDSGDVANSNKTLSNGMDLAQSQNIYTGGNTTLPYSKPGTMIYDQALDVDEFPSTEAAPSIFNNFSLFAYSMVGGLYNCGYEQNMHYDYLGLEVSDGDSPHDSSVSFNKFTQEVLGYNQDVSNEYTDQNNEENKERWDYYGSGKWEDIRRWYYSYHHNYTLTDDEGNDFNQNVSDLISESGFDRPTVQNLVAISKNETQAGRRPTMMPYAWSDFLYCKFYGKIPNNRLITLRRFPFNVGDNPTYYNPEYPLVPVAQAVTWFGEGTGNTLSQLSKMQYGLEWKELTASVQTVDGNEGAMGTGVEDLFGGEGLTSIIGTVDVVLDTAVDSANGEKSSDKNDQYSGLTQAKAKQLKNAWNDDGAYWNQVLGPVNVIDKTYMRNRGMKFSHSISIKFSYVLRSWNGINPKIAMLDLIQNFLRLTTNNAKFWGGATRYFPNLQNQIGFLGNQEAFYAGDWSTYFKSVKKSFASMGEKLQTLLNSEGTFGNVLTAAAKVTLGNLAQKSRPEMLSIKTLLRGDPVGEWHLTVGNPFNPILVIGNLLVDTVDMEFGDSLGMDDFPTEVTFTVSLKHGRPRDLGDIESMINIGLGKMSYSPLFKSYSEVGTNGADGSTNSDQKDYANVKERDAATKDGGNNSVSAYIKNGGLLNSKGNPAYDNKNFSDEYQATAHEISILKNTANKSTVRGRVYENWGARWAVSKSLTQIVDVTKCKF